MDNYRILAILQFHWLSTSRISAYVLLLKNYCCYLNEKKNNNSNSIKRIKHRMKILTAFFYRLANKW